FQAEDGIRDRTVTGVQTCALPISSTCRARSQVVVEDVRVECLESRRDRAADRPEPNQPNDLALQVEDPTPDDLPHRPAPGLHQRSEERRVGKECRPWRPPQRCKKT